MKRTGLLKLIGVGLIVVIISIGLVILPGEAEAVRTCVDDSNCNTNSNTDAYCDLSRGVPGTCVCSLGNFEVGWFDKIQKGTSVCDFLDLPAFGTPSQSIGYLINILVVAIIALVVMAAMVTVVVGGYIYMTAMGNADRVRQAKIWIGAALLGIFLALAAYTILNFINPSLVTF